MSRREFSRSTKLSAYERSEGKCDGCGLPLQKGRFHYDHIIADAHGGGNSLDNCQVLCLACHGEKTPTDTRLAAKIKRQKARDVGAEAPKQKIQSRGFQKRPKRGRIELPNTLPPPPLMRASMETSE